MLSSAGADSRSRERIENREEPKRGAPPRRRHSATCILFRRDRKTSISTLPLTQSPRPPLTNRTNPTAAEPKPLRSVCRLLGVVLRPAGDGLGPRRRAGGAPRRALFCCCTGNVVVVVRGVWGDCPDGRSSSSVLTRGPFKSYDSPLRARFRGSLVWPRCCSLPPSARPDRAASGPPRPPGCHMDDDESPVAADTQCHAPVTDIGGGLD